MSSNPPQWVSIFSQQFQTDLNAAFASNTGETVAGAGMAEFIKVIGYSPLLTAELTQAQVNHDTIVDVPPPGQQSTGASVGGGAGAHGTADVSYGTTSQGDPVVVTGSSAGTGIGAASSVTGTTTIVGRSTNLWNAFISLVCGWAICGF